MTTSFQDVQVLYRRTIFSRNWSDQEWWLLDCDKKSLSDTF